MSVRTDSSEATVCHHDHKLNISLPPHTATKAIKRSSSPGGGRWRGGVRYMKVHIQASSLIYPSKFIIVMETVSHNCSFRGMEALLRADSRTKSLWLPLCAYTFRLTLIHLSVNAILYSNKFNFLTVGEAERERHYPRLSRI